MMPDQLKHNFCSTLSFMIFTQISNELLRILRKVEKEAKFAQIDHQIIKNITHNVMSGNGGAFPKSTGRFCNDIFIVSFVKNVRQRRNSGAPD